MRRQEGSMETEKDFGLNEHKCGKMRFFVFKKKTLIAIILCVVVCAVCIGGGIGIAATAADKPAVRPLIVVDPGHGGIDYGVTGRGGTKESEFNLEMSRTLAELLEGAGFSVVMTRTDENGLYGDADDNFKKADMAARKKIIQDSAPDLVISIHANKFPGEDRRGAQVFFDGFNEGGKSLANFIQSGLNSLNTQYVGRTYSALKGDYFILKCSLAPSVIVECGFLSNAEDEKLLNDAEYRKKLAFAVYSGAVGYLTESEAFSLGEEVTGTDC